MKILILEDEIYNFHLLQSMLGQLYPEHYVVGPITTVKHAIEYFQMHADADIIIADVQLNDGLSFNALNYAPADVPIIFTTAYEQHALQAFEYNSLSYLLKPIDEDELRLAIKKAERLITNHNPQPITNNPQPNTRFPFANDWQDTPYRKRFLVKTGRGERVILLDSIHYILSENKTTYIKLLDGTSYPIALSLEAVAQQLDPHSFMRVNRKYIVPLTSVAGTQLLTRGKELLTLRGTNPPEIIVSRDKRQAVKQWLES